MKGLAIQNVANAFVAKFNWMMANHAQATGDDANALYTSPKTYGILGCKTDLILKEFFKIIKYIFILHNQSI